MMIHEGELNSALSKDIKKKMNKSHRPAESWPNAPLESVNRTRSLQE